MALAGRNPAQWPRLVPSTTSGLIALALLGLSLLFLLARLWLTPAIGLPLSFLVVFIVAAAAGLLALFAVALRRDRSLSVLVTLAIGLLSATWLAAEAIGGGGGTPQLSLGPGDSGRTLTVSQGTQVMIQLPANPSTGYGWTASISDSSVLAQDGDSVFKASSSAVGAGGTYTIWYRATGAGRSTLRLDYARSWEAGVAPLETFQVEVVVR
jgi:inhibitor of cysteine peptidase